MKNKVKFMNKDKLEFINNEILTSTIFAGLGRGYAVYKDGVKKKDEFKKFLRQKLVNYSKKYKNKIDEDKHIKNIEKFANDVSNKFGCILEGKRLRVGRAQKLLNLYLKYLWVLERIPEPVHCPFDSRIISKIGLNINWTALDSIKDYKKLVNATRKKAEKENLSIAGWELQTWNQDNLKIN